MAGNSRALKRAFYTIPELSRITGIGYKTLLKQVQADMIPSCTFGACRTLLVPAEFVDASSGQAMEHWFGIMRARGLMGDDTATGELEER